MIKSSFLILLFIGCISVEAQTTFLKIFTHVKDEFTVIVPDSIVKFNIASNTNWIIQSIEPWVTVSVQLYYTKDGSRWMTLPYSGSAPDIGAFEFPQDYANGRDTAFVTLTLSGTNINNFNRTATINISGIDVITKTIIINQINPSVPNNFPTPKIPSYIE